MLSGIDISGYQTEKQLKSSPYYTGADFVFVKASEGVGYVSDSFKSHVKMVENDGKLLGIYHFARPDLGNSGKEEADYFYKIAKQYVGKAVFALDYEGYAHTYGQDWALEFLNRFYTLSGVKPMIYLSQSMIPNYRKVCNADYGLWVAQWSSKLGSIEPWKFYAVWQYRDAPFDLNKFNGDVSAWKAYAKSRKGSSATNMTSTSKKYYTVKKGDTLYDIAKKYNMLLTDLIKLNPQIENPDLIYVNQKVRIK